LATRTSDPVGYNGQWGYYTDSETGLMLCTYRYYDPANGRWLTRDPIGDRGGVNIYGYVGNEPSNRRDPKGLMTLRTFVPQACIGCVIGVLIPGGYSFLSQCGVPKLWNSKWQSCFNTNMGYFVDECKKNWLCKTALLACGCACGASFKIGMEVPRPL